MSRRSGNQESSLKSEKMQRYYAERETTGPEFDDRLIKLVRANPAIYDVSHPHYRRNPVRVDIWDRIANELGASSRFLQTKWKNIRYNYLQEVKAIETGQTNPNVRKRRFTEDLSFLQNTAQTYNVKKSQSFVAPQNGGGSDNDSNSFLYPDPEHLKIDASEGYDIIELDNSEDGENSDDNEIVPELHVMAEEEPKLEHHSLPTTLNGIHNSSSDHSHERDSPASSPLLTPMVVMGNGYDQDQVVPPPNPKQDQKQLKNSSLSNGEVTIEPIYKPAATRRTLPSDFLSNPFKRKAAEAPLLQSQVTTTPYSDPIELYCLSLVDTLRNMPRSERERVKFEFASILKDAKYKDES
ncbi:uncharacterized protein LOC128253872 [Drosophila gunungcola]|uniref:Dorsal interacting protein 3 n=1 Tax=Drosophila gunungcola TaxID=103775 RepID=A0A9P9YMH1_9MUSC|nr:uncharacterized protein LOC128253872 [Drosophila gunungcola]KAI8039699.1 hypothetical protein M5D96_007120 [Drosophila gunungcola]